MPNAERNVKDAKDRRGPAGSGGGASPIAAATGRVGRWPTVIRPWLGTAIRVVIGVVWIVAGAQKVGHPGQFVAAVHAYEVVPGWLAKAIGYGLPYLEIGIGVLLIAGLATQFLGALSAVLFVVFLTGIIQASARGLNINCGCFGGGGAVKSGQTSYTVDIIRDIALFLGSAWLLLWSITKLSTDGYVRNTGAPDPRTARVGPRRTKEAQERVAALVAKRRKEQSKRILLVTSIAAVVLIALGFIGIAAGSHVAHTQAAAQAKIANQTPTSAYPQGNVASLQAAKNGQIVNIPDKNGVLVGKASAPVTLDVYEDFICPICGDFQKQSGAAIDAMITGGKARVQFHMLNFLNQNSQPAGYSGRAASAAGAAAKYGKFLAYHDLLYAHQPAEGSAGLSNAQLIAYGKQAGITAPPFAAAVNAGKYTGWVTAVNSLAFGKEGIGGTPTVKINGKVVGPAGGVPTTAQVSSAVQQATKGTFNGNASGKSSGKTIGLVVGIVVVVLIIGLAIAWSVQGNRRRTAPRPKSSPGAGASSKTPSGKSPSGKAPSDKAPSGKSPPGKSAPGKTPAARRR